uniref:CDK2 associated cullin domain 1 n=1 Tax=Cyprinus carpio TaxID=7962 RepID=A0A8C1RKS3_CYPCA
MQGVEDDNHNCRAEAVSVCSPAQVCVDSDSCSDTCESTSALLLNSTAKFHLNVMTAEEYKTVYWPKLERAIEHLLTQSPMEHISISYEQIYSQVYKCVCQQHSELLYNDLMWKIRSHLEQVSSELQVSAETHSNLSVVLLLWVNKGNWVPLAPALFSRFIPQIHPPALESQLLYYADQDKKLQLELHQNGFSRGDQSRKRASEES